MKGKMYMEENVVEEIFFIEEEQYQQIKKEMCKTDDYFTIEEWKKLGEKLT